MPEGLQDSTVSRGACTRYVKDGLCEDVLVCKVVRWDIPWSHLGSNTVSAPSSCFVCHLLPLLLGTTAGMQGLCLEMEVVLQREHQVLL